MKKGYAIREKFCPNCNAKKLHEVLYDTEKKVHLTRCVACEVETVVSVLPMHPE